MTPIRDHKIVVWFGPSVVLIGSDPRLKKDSKSTHIYINLISGKYSLKCLRSSAKCFTTIVFIRLKSFDLQRTWALKIENISILSADTLWDETFSFLTNPLVLECKSMMLWFAWRLRLSSFMLLKISAK